MNRLFGTKNTTPKPTLNDAIKSLDERRSTLDVRLAKVNGELATYQEKLSNMREGPGKQHVKQRALKILRQRKQLEAQIDQLESQSWNMEQAQSTSDNLRNTMITLDAMKTANKDLKKQYGKIDLDKIEDMQDEMADLLEMADDLQETMARSYDVPEDVDEAELDAELEALGDEIAWQETPSYLEETPKFVDEEPEAAKVQEAT